MPTLAEIQAKATTALTNLEVERAREIADIDSFSEALTLTGELTEEQRQATRADFDEWDSYVDKTTKLAPNNSENVDYDPYRNLERIKVRVRLRLGLAPYSTTDALGDPNAIQCVTLSCGPGWMATDCEDIC